MSATRQPGAWRPDVPSTLDGRYLIEAEIEALAYGVLYAARDTVSDEPVAITVFHPAFFAAPYRKRNLERIRRTLRYRHPNLAAVRLVADEHAPVYVVADPIVGQPLTLWRREGKDAPAAPEAAYRIVGQLLGALGAVHAHGVHGAIGPSTVRVAAGHAWLSNPWHLEPPSELPPGELPPLRAAWLAPEQLYDVAPEGPATDIYACGLVLGFLLARGLTEPGHSLMVQGLDVLPPLDEVYVRATARQPELRYASVGELSQALEAAVGPAWRSAQVALDAPLYEHVFASGARSEQGGAAFVGSPDDAPAAHPSADDTPFDGIPILSRTLVDGELDVERTVEEEAIPAEILAFTATAEALAIPLEPSGIVDARELDDVEGLAATGPPPLPSEATAEGLAELEVVEAEVFEVEVEATPEVAPPPPLPRDAEWVGPPSPSDTVPSDIPPTPIELTPPPALEAPGTHDTGERLAVAAGGESWVLEARKLSEAVRSGRPIEGAITRVPTEPAVTVPVPAVAPAAPVPPPLPTMPPPVPTGQRARAAPPAPTARRTRPAGTAPLTIEVASGTTDSVAEPRSGLPPMAVVDAPITRASAPHMPAAAPSPPPTRESRRGLWIAAAAFLILGGVAAALLFGGEGSTPSAHGAGDAFAGDRDAGATQADAGAIGVAVGSDAAESDTTLAVADSGPDDDLALATSDGVLADGALALAVGQDAGDNASADATEAADANALAAAPDGVSAPPEDVVVAVAADTLTPAPADTVVAEAEDTVVVAAEDTVEAPDDTRAAAPIEDTAGGATATFVPTDWRKLNCPGGMAKVRSKIQVTLAGGAKVADWEVFCVDRYEAPGAGQSPTVDIDFASARAACASGGKRLCTRSEWRKSCGAKYPYGRTYDPDACNSVGSDGMPRPVLVSGSKAKCKSGWGTYDMVGNVAEWTSDGTVNGGGAYKHGESGTCYQSSRRSGGHPYVGYRCCADAR